ncbi:unnamed protein product [Owenia fusiformis]|uniref:Uncharacterized protein n=1 Tax=Owenia fusiformis TaxID=6347 RepID=A0A8J1UKZ8_OWEFU|nr:unnamed protein product [Owenia fusiformis]
MQMPRTPLRLCFTSLLSFILVMKLCLAEYSKVATNFRTLAMPEDEAEERYSIREAIEYVHPTKITTDGRFGDLNYGDSDAYSTHGLRLCQIIQAHHLDHLDNYLYQNSSTLEWIIKSWEYLAYSAPVITDWNWWVLQISTPRSLWPGLYLSRESISNTLYDDLIQRYWTDAEVWDVANKDGKMSASNLANRGFLGLFEAYFQGETIFRDRTNEVIQLLRTEIVNKSSYQGEGIGADYCIHTHNIHVGLWEGQYTNSHLRLMIYNGGYGAEYLKRFALIHILLHETAYKVDELVLSEFINAFLECHQYLCRGQTFEPSVVGRNIDDNQRVTYWAAYDSVYKVANMLLILDFRKAELENILSRYHNHGPTNESTALIGNRALFASDMMVHHRQAYMASIRMFSSRTVRPETWISSRRTQNPNGYFTGDGFTTFLQDDHEFGSRYNEVFQYYDWEKIPGTTVIYNGYVPHEGMERVGDTPNFPHHISDANFVGSASDGMYGVAAMVYDRPTVNITLKKSWFLFDNEIVCLGSDLFLRNSNDTIPTIITTLNQLVQDGEIAYVDSVGPWRNANSDMTTNVQNAKWVHHDNMGYAFPNEANVYIDSYEKTASGERLNVTAMWIKHGLGPYAYIVYPNVTIDQLDINVNAPTVEILQQDKDAHIVYQRSLDVLSMIVFTAPFLLDHPNLLYPITVNQSCILMIRHISSNDSLSITVSFPTQLSAEIMITLGVRISGDDVLPNASENTYGVLFSFSDEQGIAGKSQTKTYRIVQDSSVSPTPDYTFTIIYVTISVLVVIIIVVVVAVIIKKKHNKVTFIVNKNSK